MSVTMNVILGTITAVIAYLSANQWLFPLIQEMLDKRKQKRIREDEYKINVAKEVFEAKKTSNETYQSQLEFQLNLVEKLQNLIEKYQSDLDEVYKEVDNLRDCVSDLKKIVLENKIMINRLRLSCCSVEDCVNRKPCKHDSQ